jgi:hypothetical protein
MISEYEKSVGHLKGLKTLGTKLIKDQLKGYKKYDWKS